MKTVHSLTTCFNFQFKIPALNLYKFKNRSKTQTASGNNTVTSALVALISILTKVYGFCHCLE